MMIFLKNQADPTPLKNLLHTVFLLQFSPIWVCHKTEFRNFLYRFPDLKQMDFTEYETGLWYSVASIYDDRVLEQWFSNEVHMAPGVPI